MSTPAPALTGQGRDASPPPPLGSVPQTYRFEHERALQCRDWLESKVFELQVLEGLNTDLESEHFSSRLYIYERILGFDFEYFPDFCVPWHLLMWEHCRWDHVYFLIHIIEQLKQPTGSGAGEPIVLDPFQVMIIFACMGPEDPETGLRIVREAILTLSRKNSKALALETPIPTPNGWTTMGEIQVGDRVLGSNGKPVRVIDTSEVFTKHDCYRMEFSNGDAIIADAGHRWVTMTKTERKRKNQPAWSVKTTEEISRTMTVGNRGDRNHVIPKSPVLDLPEVDLPIDPWMLGYWLGNGDSSGARVHCHLQDFIQITRLIEQSGEGVPVVETRKGISESLCMSININSFGRSVRGEECFRKRLRETKLMGDKHIPKRYLRASESQRRALLQGLLDSDGHAVTNPINGTGQVQLTLTNNQLARDALELIRTLGVKATGKVRKTYIYGDRKQDALHIQFSASRDEGWFRLERKNNDLPERSITRGRTVTITRCELIDDVPTKCIAVDAPDSLFLAGECFTPTHNTASIAALVTALMSLSPDDYGLKGQEIQIGASDKKQAGIAYSMVERYIQFDTTLGIGKRFKLTPSRKELAHRGTLTELRCLSSDVHRQHGGNPAVVLLDEIGNVPNAQAQAFYSVLTTAFGAQIEPLTFLFSTQAPNDQHMFSQMVDRAMRINEGMIEDYSFVGFVFTVPEHDLDGKKISPYDESMWRMGNPGLGTILSVTDIKDWAKKARDLPSLQNQFENLKLNRRVSETEALLSRSAWADNSSGYDLEDLWGAKCTLGLDLSETTDLAALVALFEPQEYLDWKMPVVCKFYLPGDGLAERAKRDKVPYDVWVREGYLNAESSGVIDYSLIAEDIKWFYENFEVSALGFDRWKIKYLIKALEDIDFPLRDENLKEWMVEVGQGFRGHTRGIELLEGLVIKGRLAHGNNPVLTWNAANAVTIKDPSGNRKIEKTKSFGRVDGIVALMCAAYARGEMEIGYEGPSDYENEDFEM